MPDSRRSQFDLLLDDLAGARDRRRTDVLRKALADDPVAQFQHMVRTLPQRRAAFARSMQTLTADLDQLAKAQAVYSMPRPENSREAFDRVHAAFRESVAAGRLTGVQAARIEAGLHHVALGIR